MARCKPEVGGQRLKFLAGMALVAATLHRFVATSARPRLAEARNEIEGALAAMRRVAVSGWPSPAAVHHLEHRLAAVDRELSTLSLAQGAWRP